MVAGPPRGVEGRAGGRPRRTVMLTGAPFRGMGVLGGPGHGPGTAGQGHAGPRVGPGGGGSGGRERCCCGYGRPGRDPDQGLTSPVPEGCPGRRRGRPAALRQGDGAWTSDPGTSTSLTATTC